MKGIVCFRTYLLASRMKQEGSLNTGRLFVCVRSDRDLERSVLDAIIGLVVRPSLSY